MISWDLNKELVIRWDFNKHRDDCWDLKKENCDSMGFVPEKNTRGISWGNCDIIGFQK